MAENDINIKVSVKGETGERIATAAREQMAAVSKAVMGPEDVQAFAAMRADKQRMAQEAANLRGHAVAMSYSAAVQRQVGENEDGTPKMEVVGQVSGRVRAIPAAMAERNQRLQQIKASYVAATVSDIKDDAAAHHIRFTDHFGGKWKPGAIQERLKVAQESADPEERALALQEADVMAKSTRKFISREFAARSGELTMKGLFAKFDQARSNVDLTKANAHVVDVIRETEELKKDLQGLKREALGSQEGKARLSHFRALTRVVADEATAQKAAAKKADAGKKDDGKKDTPKNDDSTRDEAKKKEEEARRTAEQEARFARLMQTTGQTAGIRAVVSGLQSAGKAFAQGDAVQGAGGLVHAAGSYIHHVGLGRMAAARTAPGGGGIGGGLAGSLMSGAGAVIMIGAKVLTAGMERGYDNSERMDKLMAEAEPLFARRTQDRYLARRRTGESTADVMFPNYLRAGGPARRVTVSDDVDVGPPTYATRDVVNGGMREGLNTLMSTVGIPDLGGAQRTLAHTVADDVTRFAHTVADNVTRTLSSLIGVSTQLSHDQAVTRALTEMTELYRLRDFGLDPEQAFQSYRDFSYAHGVGRRATRDDVTRMRVARLMGLPDAVEAESLRVSALNPRDGSGSTIQMVRALASAGVMGGPQHSTISSLLQQLAAEQAAGMTPSTTVTGNIVEAMTQAGVSYPFIPTLRGMASQGVQANLSGARGRAQSIMRGMMAARAFRGRTYDEGIAFMGETDPMAQMAGAYGELPPALQRFVALGMSPAQRKQVEEAMRLANARNLAERPPAVGDDEAFTALDAFKRPRALVGAAWGLLGKQRSIDAIEAGQTFKASLDDAADALRKVGDAAAVAGIGVTNFFGVTTGGD